MVRRAKDGIKRKTPHLSLDIGAFVLSTYITKQRHICNTSSSLSTLEVSLCCRLFHSFLQYNEASNTRRWPLKTECAGCSKRFLTDEDRHCYLGLYFCNWNCLQEWRRRMKLVKLPPDVPCMNGKKDDIA